MPDYIRRGLLHAEEELQWPIKQPDLIVNALCETSVVVLQRKAEAEAAAAASPSHADDAERGTPNHRRSATLPANYQSQLSGGAEPHAAAPQQRQYHHGHRKSGTISQGEDSWEPPSTAEESG